MNINVVPERSDVHGFALPGFEPVVREFERNFAERGELGAAFAAVHDGEMVVDLWGGVADRAAQCAWNRDTLVMIFSGSKALVAVCLLMLIDRNRLELDVPVATYWPEFAAAGKDQITVRQVVTHTAGLPGLATPITHKDLLDDRRMAALVASEAQLDVSSAMRSYHALTYGWLCGELVRRIDGRSVGRFFEDEVAGPLGLDIYLGLPEKLEARVSRLEPGWDEGMAFFDPRQIEDDPHARAVLANPVFFRPFPWNDGEFQTAEIPAVNAIGTMRAIASLFGKLDTLMSRQTMDLGRCELERWDDPVTQDLSAYGVGFLVDCRPPLRLGPPLDAFGHDGAGGSVHGAWPTQRVGFSYAPNLLRINVVDPRSEALLRALYECVVA